MKLKDINNIPLIWGNPSNNFIETTKDSTFIIPEMRPSLLGLNVAKRLNINNKVVYITDNMIGLLFYKNKISNIIFFFIEKNDNYYSCIPGSLYLYLLAKNHKINIDFLEGKAVEINKVHTSILEEFYSKEYMKAKEEIIYLEEKNGR